MSSLAFLSLSKLLFYFTANPPNFLVKIQKAGGTYFKLLGKEDISGGPHCKIYAGPALLHQYVSSQVHNLFHGIKIQINLSWGLKRQETIGQEPIILETPTATSKSWTRDRLYLKWKASVDSLSLSLIVSVDSLSLSQTDSVNSTTVWSHDNQGKNLQAN